MAIAIASTRQSVADNGYKALTATPHVNLATGNPGSAAAPANEATGGGNARKPFTWTSGTGGVLTGSQVSIDLAAAVYTHWLYASAVSGANQFDNGALSSPYNLVAPGSLLATPYYTQS